jgi:predicted protein tyrosine phosphatase
MCQGGNVRSVAIGYVLKYQYGIDAIACSWEANTQETRDMLCNWADSVIVMEASFAQYIPQKYHSKLQVMDVGPDMWGNSLHPQLIELIQKRITIVTV